MASHAAIGTRPAQPDSGTCSHWIDIRHRRWTAQPRDRHQQPSIGRGARATGICGSPRRKGWSKLIRHIFPVNTLPPRCVRALRRRRSPISRCVAQTLLLKIPAGHVHFEFDYAGLSFVAPQKVRYRYMLEGFDHDWTEAGARRTAYYTNIPPGNYTFRVQAANNDGVWNTTARRLPFRVAAAFLSDAVVLRAAAAWRWCGLVSAGACGCVCSARSASSMPCWASATASRARFTTRWRRAMWAFRSSLEVLAELLRSSKVDAAQKQLD